MTIRSLKELEQASEYWETALDRYRNTTDDERDYLTMLMGELEKADAASGLHFNEFCSVAERVTMETEFYLYDRELDELLYQLKYGDADFRDPDA